MTIIQVREYESFELESEEATEFELLLQRIWTERRLNPTFDQNSLPVDEEKDSIADQRLFAVTHHRHSKATRFTASKYIGIFQTNTVKVIVTPKVFNIEDPAIFQNLLLMLRYAEGLKTPVSPDVSLGDTQIAYGYEELLIFLFAELSYRVLQKRGYLYYQAVQENSGFVRGKILHTQNLLQNTLRARQDRVFCEYELYQEDNIFNRILKYVTKGLLSRTSIPSTRRTLQRILDMLGHITEQQCTARDCDVVHFNNWQREWMPVLQYCRLFLSQKKPFWHRNTINLDYFVIDMNDLFEKYVAGLLKSELSNEWFITPSASGTYLTQDNQFQLRYDILMVHKPTGRRIIVDTKYKTNIYLEKRGSDTGIASQDLYQMVSYAVRENCHDVFLVYPLVEQDSEAIKQLDIDAFSGLKTVRITAIKASFDAQEFMNTLRDLILDTAAQQSESSILQHNAP